MAGGRASAPTQNSRPKRSVLPHMRHAQHGGEGEGSLSYCARVAVEPGSGAQGEPVPNLQNEPHGYSEGSTVQKVLELDVISKTIVPAGIAISPS